MQQHFRWIWFKYTFYSFPCSFKIFSTMPSDVCLYISNSSGVGGHFVQPPLGKYTQDILVCCLRKGHLLNLQLPFFLKRQTILHVTPDITYMDVIIYSILTIILTTAFLGWYKKNKHIPLGILHVFSVLTGYSAQKMLLLPYRLWNSSTGARAYPMNSSVSSHYRLRPLPQNPTRFPSFFPINFSCSFPPLWTHMPLFFSWLVTLIL